MSLRWPHHILRAYLGRDVKDRSKSTQGPCTELGVARCLVAENERSLSFVIRKWAQPDSTISYVSVAVAFVAERVQAGNTTWGLETTAQPCVTLYGLDSRDPVLLVYFAI